MTERDNPFASPNAEVEEHRAPPAAYARPFAGHASLESALERGAQIFLTGYYQLLVLMTFTAGSLFLGPDPRAGTRMAEGMPSLHCVSLVGLAASVGLAVGMARFSTWARRMAWVYGLFILFSGCLTFWVSNGWSSGAYGSLFFALPLWGVILFHLNEGCCQLVSQPENARQYRESSSGGRYWRKLFITTAWILALGFFTQLGLFVLKGGLR